MTPTTGLTIAAKSFAPVAAFDKGYDELGPFPPAPTLVVLETTSPVPPESWVRIELDASLPSPAGPASPGRPQDYVVQAEQALFVDGFECQRHCDPEQRNAVQLRRPVAIAGFAWPLLLLIPWLARLIERRGLLTGLNVALLISVPLAPYGWSFDQVVLIPAIVQAIFWWRLFDKRRQRRYWLILIGIYLVALFIKLSGLGDFWFVWIVLAIGGLYAAVYVENGRKIDRRAAESLVA